MVNVVVLPMRESSVGWRRSMASAVVVVPVGATLHAARSVRRFDPCGRRGEGVRVAEVHSMTAARRWLTPGGRSPTWSG